MDIFGQALADHYYKKTSDILWLYNSYGEPEEMPVDVFFRTGEEMPELELLALEYCRGKILDTGAGAGSHTLLLQAGGEDVTALELNPTACSIMKERGINKIVNQDIFAYSGEKFDTLLLLMNGIGLCKTVAGLHHFLQHAATLLNDNGQIIFDSSDISYLYEDGGFPSEAYFGEISYQYEYEGKRGPWFNWLYIDWHSLADIATDEGWTFRLLYEDGQDQYLASLEKKL